MRVKVGSLTPENFLTTPVWQHVIDFGASELIEPAPQPIYTLDLRIIGGVAKRPGGKDIYIAISGLDARRPEKNAHFASFSIWWNSQWFHLARYFDADFEKKSPVAFCRQYNLTVNDIFPINYDFSHFVMDPAAAVAKGQLNSDYNGIRLSRQELAALAVG